MMDEVKQILAMNPTLSLEEINLVLQQKAQEVNNRPLADFCGLSSSQMSNWLYAPFHELSLVKIGTPEDLSSSPVIRYLSLILEEALESKGGLKLTAKGNLPAYLVKQASDLLPEFAVSQFESHISFSQFAGANEDKFDALHYTRRLAEVVGIVYKRAGYLHVKKEAQKQYRTQGVRAFYLPMLQAAVTQYNWAYFDGFSPNVDLRMFWLFMVWRLSVHGRVDQMLQEMQTAFPALLDQVEGTDYSTPVEQFGYIVDCRLLRNFLQFWGYVVINPLRYVDGKRIPPQIHIQPLLRQTIEFLV